MNSRDSVINKSLVIGWAIIVAVLIVIYIGEVFKGERTIGYYLLFLVFAVVPVIAAIFIYRKKTDSVYLRYVIVVGYFFMYTFVMVTGSTFMVFSYIFPMLSLIILYRQKNLILFMGIVSIVINILHIVIRINNGDVNLVNSKEIEIQMALLILCFSFCYVAAKLYGNITQRNMEYVNQIDQQSKELQQMSFEVITTIANTIDAKDDYTNGHSRRVSEYSYALAKELGMSEEEASDIRIIALLHDIGKIGVPDAVLNKPGKLNDTEIAMMKTHSVIGAEILKNMNMVSGINIGARHHHERYDGNGYPDGLKGEEIPYVARIICIADAYDAMSSNRVYRNRLSDEKIMQELENCKGKQFDTEIANAFIRLLKENRLYDVEEDDENELISAIRDSKRIPTINEIQKTATKENDDKKLLDKINMTKETTVAISNEIEKQDGCLMLLDMDNLSTINEKCGYHRGDYYLNIVAETLVSNIENPIVARISGDCFICLLRDIETVKEAKTAVISLLDKLNMAIASHGRDFPTTLSAGVALSSISGKDFTQLYQHADKALYHVKQNGKNGFYIYNNASKIQNNNISQRDLDNLVRIIQEQHSYHGAFSLNYHEFEKIYEFANNPENKNADSIQLVLFTVSPEGEMEFSMDSREHVMQYLERAIVETVKNVELTTRYSSTQQMVMFANLAPEVTQSIVEHMINNFYRMYDKRDIVLKYDIANLNFDKKPEENEK